MKYKVDKNKLAELLNLHSMVDEFKANEIKPAMISKVQKVIDRGMKKNPKWNPDDVDDYQGQVDDDLINALVEIADQLNKKIVESNNNNTAMANNVQTVKTLKGGKKIASSIIQHLKGKYKMSEPLQKDMRLKVVPKLHVLIKENKEVELDSGEFNDFAKLLNTDAQSLADEVSGIIKNVIASMEGDYEEDEEAVLSAYQKNMEEGYDDEELLTRTMEDTEMEEDAVKKILKAHGMMEDEEGHDLPEEMKKTFNYQNKKYKVVKMSDDEDPIVTMEGESEEDEDVEMKRSKFDRFKKYSVITEDLEDNNDGTIGGEGTTEGDSDDELLDNFDLKSGKSYKLASGKVVKFVSIKESIEEEDDEGKVVVVEDENGDEDEIPAAEFAEMEPEEYEDGGDDEDDEEDIDESYISIKESKKTGIKSVQLKSFTQIHSERLMKNKRK